MSDRIEYFFETVPQTEEIISLFDDSGINRPTSDPKRIEEMFNNANLICCARKEGELVGIGRALTDFSYCCYVSDLAVLKNYQGQGIGKKILEKLKEKAGDRCVFFLHAAPSAKDYYPKIGFQTGEHYFEIKRKH